MSKPKEGVVEERAGSERLAMHGGSPVRTEPLPLEFPGVHHMDDEEIAVATNVLRSRSLFLTGPANDHGRYLKTTVQSHGK